MRTVLFDLDGTLADTAPDLAFALNAVLTERGYTALSDEVIRPVVSHGTPALIQLGFKLTPNQTGYDDIKSRLIEIYKDNIAQYTRLFPGMAEVLDAIEQAGLNWGVVTNKPSNLTLPLMQQLGLDQRAVCIVSGDTTPNPKPHPEPMLLASKLSNSIASKCLYIGDAKRDIDAGKSAGMTSLAALFGYIDEDDDPYQWGADGYIHQPSDILYWLA